MALPNAGRFSVSPDVISQQYMGETMLLNVKTLVYVRLDSLAGSLWQLLEKFDDLDSVFAELKIQQDLSPEYLEKFFKSCIISFRRARLIIPG